MSDTDLITSTQAREILGVSQSTLSRWVADGKLAPTVQGAGVRGPMFFDRADVESLHQAGAA
jgi:predicted site-specific integrase-resolvase